jgi:hypothetical protein
VGNSQIWLLTCLFNLLEIPPPFQTQHIQLNSSYWLKQYCQKNFLWRWKWSVSGYSLWKLLATCGYLNWNELKWEIQLLGSTNHISSAHSLSWLMATYWMAQISSIFVCPFPVTFC